MLIRISGGTGGIKEYLESGQKQGRELSRDELDTRIILDGNLTATNELIQLMDTEGERYLHITLAFKEDHIKQSMLDDVVNEFKQFAFAAYEPDEYNFYAEAHIPKIASYTNSKTGELVERKPHIHIVIPKTNKVSGNTLNPFGMVDMTGIEQPNKAFINAFQEHINNKFGLSSPKDNPRFNFTGDSEMISRYAGDLFEGGNKDIKAKIFEEILARKISWYEDFKTLLSEFGETRTRNQGRENEYQNIKVPGAEKGINLDGSKSGHFMFSRKFIEMSESEKNALLTSNLTIKYEQVGAARSTPEEQQAILKEWYEVRAKEIKYINSGNQKAYKNYRESTYEERVNILTGYEQRFNQKFRKEISDDRKPRGITTGYSYKQADGIIKPKQDNQQLNANELGKLKAAKRPNRMRSLSSSLMDGNAQQTKVLLPNNERLELDGRRAERTNALRRVSSSRRLTKTTDALPNQLLRNLEEQKQAREAEATHDTAKIINNLEANRLLADLSLSHGVITSKYEVTKNKAGVDRIKSGNRNLSVSDFLTKELQMPWAEAEKILKASYQKQIDNTQTITKQAPQRSLWEAYREGQPAQAKLKSSEWNAQRESEKLRRADIRNDYQLKRKEIQGDRSTPTKERKAALSIARMERATKDMALRQAIAEERQKLKEKHNKPHQERYCSFLTELANQGDEKALAELRRQRTSHPAPASQNAIEGSNNKEGEGELNTIQFVRTMAYSVDIAGNVTYYADKSKKLALLVDSGKSIDVIETKNSQAVEAGLRMAVQKFGNNLKIEGNKEFKHQVIDVVLKAGLQVTFEDKAMNAELNRRRADREEQQARGKAFIESQRQPTTQPPAAAQPTKIKEQESERPQVVKKQKNRDAER
ncbi:MAG: LPD7 domain-containing protein [Methylophilaceae bacterium]